MSEHSEPEMKAMLTAWRPPDAPLEVKSSVAGAPGSARSSFEQWISGPPYERSASRYPENEQVSAWPGQYKDYAVQLAWEAWRQAQNADSSDPRKEKL